MDGIKSVVKGLSATEQSNSVPLPDLYFDSFSHPVAPIVSSAGGALFN